MVIWALTDNRIGNSKQTLALANALGNFTEKKISFSKISKLPNKLLGRSLLGVKADFTGQKPDVIISSGRKLARVALALKKKYKCKAIHIMYPGKELATKFDHLIVPAHDSAKGAKNLIRITGAISIVKKHDTIVKAGMNQTTVLIGNITEEEAESLVKTINTNQSLYFITTSRRTNEKVVKILETKIRQPHKLHKYGSVGQNPYDSFLESADILIVTGDSVNMCTEAAHTGKPVYIMEVETKPKFHKLWNELYKLGIARKLENKLESWEYKPLDNINTVKKHISLAT